MAYKRTSNRNIKPKSWEDRLWKKIKFAPYNACWEWTAGKNEWGYGTFGRNNGSCLAHRSVWESVYGEIPEGLLVLHKCDNPPCCRPDHLFLGTNADNVKDRHTKGRSRGGSLKGEKHPNSKLTDEQVKRIRNTQNNLNVFNLATEFNVHPETIREILHGRGWNHIKENK